MIFTLTMLRRRNNPRRVTTTKQAPSLMADQSKPNTCHSSSSLFTSPKFRNQLPSFLTSPTSILEANSSIFSSSSFKNPKPKFQPPEDESFFNGLADLVKNREDQQNLKKQVNKKVLFGSKLRVQIPSTDFGTKTGLRYRGQISPCIQTKVLTGLVRDNSTIPDQTEDYTRVISHGGPNPTITHIFDNSVFVESKPLPLAMEIIKKKDFKKTDDFFSYCYTCKKNLLDHKQDIYIYRGEKGFCSSECRYQEMLLDQMES